MQYNGGCIVNLVPLEAEHSTGSGAGKLVVVLFHISYESSFERQGDASSIPGLLSDADEERKVDLGSRMRQGLLHIWIGHSI